MTNPVVLIMTPWSQIVEMPADAPRSKMSGFTTSWLGHPRPSQPPLKIDSALKGGLPHAGIGNRQYAAARNAPNGKQALICIGPVA
jgi:hypothetical protein